MSITAEENAAEAPNVPKQFAAHSCRQARRLLTWTQVELADRSGVRLQAIKDFERLDEVRDIDRAAIHAALRRGGLERLRMLAAELRCEYPQLPPERCRTSLDIPHLTAAIVATITRELTDH